MKRNAKLSRTVRWMLSVGLVVLGILATWGWGEVARLAAAPEEATAAGPRALYAVWPTGAGLPGLFETTDEGVAWQPVNVPAAGGAAPIAWAADGQDRLAVALSDGSVLRSMDGGQSWATAAEKLGVLSLAWGEGTTLYAGTERQGLLRLAEGGAPAPLAPSGSELSTTRIQHLAVMDGRLFAATPTALFYTDDGGTTWTKSTAPAPITALAVTGRDAVYLGTDGVGVFKSAGGPAIEWQPAIEGLGLAAGQAVQVTALAADPREPEVVYAAISYAVGGTQVVSSAEGTFVTLDAGRSWQELAGPHFPDAKPASQLVVLPGRGLTALAVTAQGPQSYTPDVAGALAALDDEDARARAGGARLLGMARVREASDRLLALLADADPAVSMAAADALGRISDPASVGSLLVALDNPSEQVRLGAARALGQMKSEAAVAPLRDMLLSGQGTEVSVAAEALGRIASPAAVDALAAALADEQLTSRRHAALGALESAGGAAVEPLARLLAANREPAARRNAAEALGWIRSPQATQALAAALRDRDPAVRRQAAWALGEIGDPAARKPLERAARDASADVQAQARASLQAIAAQPAAAARQSFSLAATLNRFQPARWLLLIVTWAAAAWLAVSSARLVPARATASRR